MKVYIAGRTKHHGSAVQKVKELVTGLGHDITFDWTDDFAKGRTLMPYHENRDAAAVEARKMVDGARDADLFILIWDDSLYGALLEAGVALGASTPESPKRIIVVGPKSRVAIFEMMNEFTVVENIDELQRVLGTNSGLKAS